MKEKIFVQIPAYRDAELSATVIDLTTKAAYPDRLDIHILWQHAENEELDKKMFNYGNVTITAVPYTESKGCNWARSLLQQQWQKQPYTLLLDAHHRFVSQWDILLIDMYQKLKKEGIEKPLLTAYLPSYDPQKEPSLWEQHPFKIYAHSRKEQLLTRLTSHPIPYWSWLQKPIPAHYISLHFIFTQGAFNTELPFDPQIYFFGDEVVTSLRAYMLGYDFFHPHRIIGWHTFNRSTRIPHWDNHPDWLWQEEASVEKMRKIYAGTYQYTTTIPPKRSISDYEAYISNKLILNC